MLHRSIEPATEIHTAWCPCSDCASRDAFGYARARRMVRFQAAVLGLFAFVIYAMVAWCAPAIADAFGLSF